MKQPWGITLNCIVLAISGVLALFGAIALVVAGTMATAAAAYLTGFGVANIASYITIGGVFLVIMSVVAFVLCYGLLKHNDIAWWAAIILLGIGIAADIVAVALANYILGPMTFVAIGVNLFLIIALLHRDTISAIRPDIKYRGWVLEA